MNITITVNIPDAWPKMNKAAGVSSEKALRSMPQSAICVMFPMVARPHPTVVNQWLENQNRWEVEDALQAQLSQNLAPPKSFTSALSCATLKGLRNNR